MEKKFICYLLYATLIEIREHAYETGDKKSFWLANLMHNVPLVLAERDNRFEDILAQIVDRAEHDHMENWLNDRKREFLHRYPE